MSDDKGTPGTVRKKRFPATLGATVCAPTPSRKLWNTVNESPLKTQIFSVSTSQTRSQAKTNHTGMYAASSEIPLAGGMAAARLRMVQRLRQQEIRYEGVLRAMGNVPRELFVDSALVNQAYEDTSLPIGLGQTISKPSVVARMIELLVPENGVKLGRVLDVGTGCGYQAAVLSQLVDEVYSIERLKGLHERARVNLRPLRLKNVHLIYGDGMQGFPSGAPYDAIIAAAGGENVPVTWLEQLSEDGCLIAPVVTAPGVQSLIKVVRTPQGWQQYELEAVQFVPLKSGVL